jgi:hypothetical protein
VVRTAAPEHVLTGALGALTAEGGYTALILGHDTDGAPVHLLMFRPPPTIVTFIGDWRTARILLLRCLGLGARAVIRAGGGLGEVPQWTDLDHAAAGTGRRVWAMPVEQPMTPGLLGTPMILYVYDGGLAGPPARQALGPWQTQLTVLGNVSQAGTQAIASADVVVAQRLDHSEASLAAAILGYGEQTVSMLSTMPDDMVMALSRGTARYAWLTPTTVERRLFG